MSKWSWSADAVKNKVRISQRRFIAVEREVETDILDLIEAEHLLSDLQKAISDAKSVDTKVKVKEIENIKKRLQGIKQENESLELLLAQLESEVSDSDTKVVENKISDEMTYGEVKKVLNNIINKNFDKWEQAKVRAELRGWFHGQVLKETNGLPSSSLISLVMNDLIITQGYGYTVVQHNSE